jgi:glycosyltransferase involved in cell wall biosynthesis
MPIVSVIIPAYNCAQFLSETLDSVLRQSFADYEIIIVDDGSKDNTLAVIEEYERSGNIRGVSQKNKGPAAARNVGIKIARGVYCAFVDADDLMMPERLSRQVQALEANKAPGLVYTDLMTFNEEGIVHRTKKEFIHPYAGWVLDRLLITNFITTSTVMVRKKCFESVGLFDEAKDMRGVEDYKMWLQISEKYPVEYIDAPLVRYRYHSNSLSANRTLNNLAGLNVVKGFWGEHPEYKNRKQRLYQKSLSEHLAIIGRCYSSESKHGEALGMYRRALKHNCFSKSAWLGTARIVLQLLKERHKT